MARKKATDTEEQAVAEDQAVEQDTAQEPESDDAPRPQEESAGSVNDAKTSDPQPRKSPQRFRYVGPTIMNFRYRTNGYQLIPGTVYTNLPAKAPQVATLVSAGQLVEV